MSEYPEHEKLKALNGANNIVANFLDWLDKQGLYLSTDVGGGLYPYHKSKAEILAAHFDIDQNKLENEKVHMIQGCRIARGENP